MKVLSIGTDRKVFESDSPVAKRIVDYGKFFNESHTVVFAHKNLNLKNIKLGENIYVYPTNSSSKLLYIWDAFLISKKIIKSNNFKANDSVVTVQDPFETGIVGLLLKFYKRLPLQVQIHTDFVNKYFIFHSALNFVRFFLSFFTITFSDSTRVVSERIKDSIHSLSTEIDVLPIYVKPVDIKPFVNKKEVIVLSVTRLEKEKDLDTAIKAFAKAVSNGAKIRYVIAGIGGESKHLMDLVKSLGIGNRVEFVGWQSDLDSLYNYADIYLSTSLYEGYGMSMVQAASAGLSLVISSTGVAGSVFEDKKEALIFEPKDIDTCASHLLKLSESSHSRSILSLAANNKFKSIYIDRDTYIKKYVDSISNAIKIHSLNKGIFDKNILLRYLVAGISGASLNIGSLYVFKEYFGIYYIYSSVLAFLVAIVLSFVLQKFWTFADKGTGNVHGQFGKYAVVGACGVCINTALMYLFVDIFTIWYILAQILTNVVIAIFNFLMYKFFIFKKV